eukprot:gene29263-29614_t
MDTPMKSDEIAACIEKLQERKQWFKDNDVDKEFDEWRKNPPKPERRAEPPLCCGKGERSGKGKGRRDDYERRFDINGRWV